MKASQNEKIIFKPFLKITCSVVDGLLVSPVRLWKMHARDSKGEGERGFCYCW